MLLFAPKYELYLYCINEHVYKPTTRISRSRFHQSRYFSATRPAGKGLCLLKTVRVVCHLLIQDRLEVARNAAWLPFVLKFSPTDR